MCNGIHCENLYDDCIRVETALQAASGDSVVAGRRIPDRRVLDRRNRTVTDPVAITPFEKVQNTLKGVFVKLIAKGEEPVIKLDLYDIVVEVRLLELKRN
jgi:hypothetical protein